MTFEIEIDGRACLVDVAASSSSSAAGGRFHVTIRTPGGVPDVLEVDARPTDLGLSIHDVATGRMRDVAVTTGSAGACLVQLPHVDVRLVVDGRRHRRPGSGTGVTTGEHRVTAPMPGRVLRVLVQAGDEVRAGQGLVVVEAMKMENALAAPGDGRVREVLVAEGASVEAGRLLVIVDHDPAADPSAGAPGLR